MRPLRAVGLGVGLVVVTLVLAGRAVLAPVARQVVREAAADARAAEPAIPAVAPGPAHDRVRAVRLGLLGLGLVVLAVGGWKLLHAALPANLVWVLVWLLGAILLHDAVIAPVVGTLRALAHRAPLPAASLAWLKAGFVVAGVLVLVVVPAIYVRHLGPANPTVLPGPYGVPLLLVVGSIGVVSVAAALLAGRRPARSGEV